MSKFETQLKQNIESMPPEKTPSRDLWRGIDKGLTVNEIDDSRVEQNDVKVMSFQWRAIAACAALVPVIWLISPSFSPTEPKQLQGYALVESLSQQQEQQLSALLASYGDAPALTENWQQQLQELDDAAKAIKLVLEEDPTNTALLNMLQQVYQQQFALIERVHAPKWQQI